ncbi:MAG: LysR family transcriptional regulator [Acidobacteria bacterium]|nr:MAG: LysR family transcriptional regulator [Acidobacteriota bacterium]REK05404.1 MAG: LysR family transcriptional regulator [Acidobacteriota bacterium]
MQALRLFCDVAALNSFSKAALKHGITQPAVSQRIRQLEEQLGVELIDRSVRPFRITQAGELLVREGRALVQSYDDLVERVRSFDETPTGDVRVSAIYSAGVGLLEGLRERFQRAYPKVRVTLAYDRPELVADAVREGDSDLGIISYPHRWPGLTVRRLRDEEMCVVCAAQHPLAKQKWVSAGSLGRWPMAGFGAELPLGRDIRRYLRSHRVTTDFAHRIDNIDTVKALLVETGSVAILPRRTVLREVAQGTLAAVELRPGLTRPMGVVTARSAGRARSANKPAEMFAEFLLRHGQAVNPVDLDDPGPRQRPGTALNRAS